MDVGLGERSYPIFIGEGTLGEGALVGPHLQGAAPQILVVTNETVGPLYLDRVSETLRAGGRRGGSPGWSPSCCGMGSSTRPWRS